MSFCLPSTLRQNSVVLVFLVFATLSEFVGNIRNCQELPAIDRNCLQLLGIIGNYQELLETGGICRLLGVVGNRRESSESSGIVGSCWNVGNCWAWLLPPARGSTATKLALAGQSGALFGQDYRPRPVAAGSHAAAFVFGIIVNNPPA